MIICKSLPFFVNVLARLIMSMFSKPKTILLDLLVYFLNVKNLELYDLVHPLPHQVGQVELVNVHCEVYYVLKAKIHAV